MQGSLGHRELRRVARGYIPSNGREELVLGCLAVIVVPIRGAGTWAKLFSPIAMHLRECPRIQLDTALIYLFFSKPLVPGPLVQGSRLRHLRISHFMECTGASASFALEYIPVPWLGIYSISMIARHCHCKKADAGTNT